MWSSVYLRSYYLPSTRRLAVNSPSTHFRAVNSLNLHEKSIKRGHGSVKSGLNYIFLMVFGTNSFTKTTLCNVLIKKKYQSLTSWAKTNHCEKARWRPTVFWLREFFFTRKKNNFYSEIWPKTYANALWADTLQFYASFVDFKCTLEELTASWRRKWVDGELTASSRTPFFASV